MARTKPITLPRIKARKLLIGGKWVEASSGKTFKTINPATGETIIRVPDGQKEDINKAVKSARKAFESGPWPTMDARDRGALLLRWADLIEKHKDELAYLEVLDNGKPISEVYAADIPLVLDTIRFYAGAADKINGETIPVRGKFFNYTLREPVGVVGQIIPWNFPMLMMIWKIAPVLATGCTSILKPAEQTPLTALRLGQLLQEAGLPDGVVNIVTGFGETAGAPLVEHPDVDKIAFTGEYKTGQIIMRAAATTLKRLSFELGGKAPSIVFNDCDVDEVVAGTIAGIFFNQGEVCCAGSRLFLQDKIHDKVMDKLVSKTKKIKVGDPFDPKTEMGAQVSEEQFNKILGYIDAGKEEGAQVKCGGSRHGTKGYFVKPTIFSKANNQMRIAREEIFGPVLTSIPFKKVDDVIKQGNDTFYGLSAAVWTKDIKKAHRVASSLRAGTIWVNCYNVFDASSPFGGYKMSGFGRECGLHGLNNYLETKSVWVNLD